MLEEIIFNPGVLFISGLVLMQYTLVYIVKKSLPDYKKEEEKKNAS